MANCTNCRAVLTGPYCSNCGQKKFSPHDLTISKFILNFFEDFFKFDSNVFKTIRYLLFRPGFLSNEYVKGRIASYVKPLKLFVFTCVIVLFLGPYIAKHDYSFALDDLDFMQNKIEEVSAKKNISKEIFIEKFNSTYLSKMPFFYLIAIIAFTLLLGLIFISQKRVFAQHLIFSLHFYTACLIFYLIESLFSKFTDISFFIVALIFPFVYLIIAVRKFYTAKFFPMVISSIIIYTVYFLIQFYWLIFTANITTSFFL